MATLQNVSGEPVDIPGLDLRVPVDGTFDVSDDDAPGLEANPAFELVEAPAPAPAATPEKTTTTDAAAPADPKEGN